MASNVIANPGAGGATFKTDDVGSLVQAPYTKLLDGTAGSSAVIPGDATNGLFVNVKSQVAPATLPLPTGAATETTLAAVSGKLPATLGQKAMAASLAVTIASDQSSIKVNDAGGSFTVDFVGQKTSDYDTGAGVDTVLMTGIALPASGGSVQGGTATNPLRTDTTGTTTQPVSAASLPLPAGAATAAKQPALGTAGAASADVISVQGIASGTALGVSGTVTVNAGAGPFPVAGIVAQGVSVSGNPVLNGLRAGTADYTAVADAQVATALATILGKQITMPYALPANSWLYAAIAGGLVNTTGVTVKAAGAAGVRNYITSVQVINSHPTIGSEVVIRDGASGTVLHRGWAQANGGGYATKFDPPLRGTAATLVEIAEITNTAATGVLVNLQGYSGAE